LLKPPAEAARSLWGWRWGGGRSGRALRSRGGRRQHRNGLGDDAGGGIGGALALGVVLGRWSEREGAALSWGAALVLGGGAGAAEL
jgi:hypothetical protein